MSDAATTAPAEVASAVPESKSEAVPAPTGAEERGLGEDAMDVLRAIVAEGDVNTLTRRTAFAELVRRLAARPDETRSEAELAQLVEREKEALRRVFDEAATQLEESVARDEQEKKRIAQSELFGDDIVMPSDEPAPKRVRRDDDEDEDDEGRKDEGDGSGEKDGTKQHQQPQDGAEEDAHEKEKRRGRRHRHHHKRHSSSSDEDEDDSDEDYKEKDEKKEDEEQEEENEDEEDGGESKRKRRKSGGVRRHRKRPSDSDGEDEDEGAGGKKERRSRKERKSRPPKEEPTEEDEVREDIFRPKRKKQQKMSDEEKRDAATVFVTRMNRAFRDDKLSVQQKKPALAKMQMLDEVESQLQNSGMTEAFLECGVLRAMAAWLTPVKVGRKTFLPNIELRTRLVKLLSTIDFDPEAHLNDGIGYAINVLHQSPEETTENKFIEHKLIDDWLRKLHDIPAKIQYNHTVTTRDDEAEEVPAGHDDDEPMRTDL